MAKNEMTEEQKQAARERMARVRAARGQKRLEDAAAASAQTEHPGESPPVESEQVAPAASEAVGRAPLPPLGKEALGKLAAAMIGNPAFSSAYEAVMRGYVQDWQNTGPLDRDKREAIYFEMRALMALRDQLGRFETQGSLASRQSQRLRLA